MKITVKGTNLKLSDSVYQYINDKIAALDKFVQNVGRASPKAMPAARKEGPRPSVGTDEGGSIRESPAVECWVEVEKLKRPGKSGNMFRAEAQIKLRGASGIRAESRQWDLHQAIDEVKDDLQQQLKRYKGKMIQKRRG